MIIEIIADIIGCLFMKFKNLFSLMFIKSIFLQTYIKIPKFHICHTKKIEIKSLFAFYRYRYSWINPNWNFLNQHIRFS